MSDRSVLQGLYEQAEIDLADAKARRKAIKSALAALDKAKVDPQPKSDRQRQARDWIVNSAGTEFIIDELAQGMGLTRAGARHYLVVAMNAGIAEEAGRRHGSMGQPPKTYRYVEKVPEPKHRRIGHAGNLSLVDGQPPRRRSSPVALGQSPKHPDKETQKVIAPALRAGADLTPTEGGHFRLVMEGKEPIVLSGSPSDHRGVKNLRAKMKRAKYPIS